MTAADLKPDLRNLIDARLDAIDRILVRAEIAWSERQSIVGEVETQIYELLARRSESPMMEDVTAILDSLDPPEAYLPEELRESFVHASGTAIPPSSAAPLWTRKALDLVSRFSRAAACGLALVLINGAIVMVVISSDGVIPWIVTLGGLVWLNYEGVRRLRAWSAAHPGSMIEDACHSLGVWLMSKGGTQPT